MSNDEIPKHRSSKDTKRWCGGKRGHEHVGRCFRHEMIRIVWYELSCEKCGRKMDYYHPRTLADGTTDKKPDWVK